MPDLNQIIGAILRDITDARSTADFATGEVSSIYLQDEVMKYLPIPHIEIKDVSIDLRFAVSKVVEDETKMKAIKAKLLKVLDEVSTHAAQATISMTKEFLIKTSGGDFDFGRFNFDELSKQLSQTLKTSFTRNMLPTDELNKRLKDFLKGSSMVKPADTGPFKVSKTAAGFMVSAVDNQGQTIIESTEPFKSRKDALEAIEKVADMTRKKSLLFDNRSVRGKVLLRNTTRGTSGELLPFQIVVPLEREILTTIGDEKAWANWSKNRGLDVFLKKTISLKDETTEVILPPVDKLHEILNRSMEAYNQKQELITRSMNPLRVDVLVNNEDLRGLPENAISSLKFSTDIKNYLWSEDESSNEYSLIPEP